MRIHAFFFSLLFVGFPALAQDIVGFPRKDFGKIALGQKQFGGKLEASIGDYNNEPISKYGSDSLFAKLGRPVGRLDILTDAGIFPCTAFLISSRYALTNHHCIPGITRDRRVQATTIEAAQLVLGYTKDGVEDGAKRFTVSTMPVEMDEELDYAVLEVFGNPGQFFGEIKVANRPPRDHSPLWIIGHPLGEAQRISREDCLSDAPAISGGRLRHRCDTLPGNSGSPVIDPTSGAAVALHHAGSSRNRINYAIPLRRIMRHSKIVAKLAGRTPPAAGSLGRDPAKSSDRQPVTPPLSEAARTWAAIKDMRSVAVLKSFAEKYEGSVFATFALARVRELEQDRLPRRQISDPKLLASVLQRGLKRLGCYSGSIDGDWGKGSADAMANYNRHANTNYPIDRPSQAAISALRKTFVRICPEAPAASPNAGNATRTSSTPQGNSNIQRPHPRRYSVRIWPRRSLIPNSKVSRQTKFGRLHCIAGDGRGKKRQCWWK